MSTLSETSAFDLRQARSFSTSPSRPIQTTSPRRTGLASTAIMVPRSQLISQALLGDLLLLNMQTSPPGAPKPTYGHAAASADADDMRTMTALVSAVAVTPAISPAAADPSPMTVPPMMMDNAGRPPT